MKWYGIGYFLEYVVSTKTILKLVALFNLTMLLWLIWQGIIGNTITSGQSDAAVFAFLTIVACNLYRWIVLEDSDGSSMY